MRILFWTHNSFAVGHVYRTCAIARAVRSLGQDDILVATGSRMSLDHLLPSTIEIVKVPSLSGYVSDGRFCYKPAALIELGVEGVSRIRARMLKTLFKEYMPDVVVIDHQPTGLNGELVELLETARASSHWNGRFVLGVRGIIDDKGSGIRYLGKFKGLEFLDKFYHSIMVYSDPRIVDFAHEYELTESMKCKIIYTGYVNPDAFYTFEHDSSQMRYDDRLEPSFVRGCREPDDQSWSGGEFEISSPNRPSSVRNRQESYTIVSGVGGGRDGFAISSLAVDIVHNLTSSFNVGGILVAGPYMPVEDVDLLREQVARSRAKIQVYRYVSNMREIIESSDLYIGMGGYNTLVQLICTGTPALILPRRVPESEQLEHVQRISQFVKHIVVRDVREDVESLADASARLLQSPAASSKTCEINMDGALNAARYIRTLHAV